MAVINVRDLLGSEVSNNRQILILGVPGSLNFSSKTPALNVKELKDGRTLELSKDAKGKLALAKTKDSRTDRLTTKQAQKKLFGPTGVFVNNIGDYRKAVDNKDFAALPFQAAFDKYIAILSNVSLAPGAVVTGDAGNQPIEVSFRGKTYRIIFAVVSPDYQSDATTAAVELALTASVDAVNDILASDRDANQVGIVVGPLGCDGGGLCYADVTEDGGTVTPGVHTLIEDAFSFFSNPVYVLGVSAKKTSDHPSGIGGVFEDYPNVNRTNSGIYISRMNNAEDSGEAANIAYAAWLRKNFEEELREANAIYSNRKREVGKRYDALKNKISEINLMPEGPAKEAAKKQLRSDLRLGVGSDRADLVKAIERFREDEEEAALTALLSFYKSDKDLATKILDKAIQQAPSTRSDDQAIRDLEQDAWDYMNKARTERQAQFAQELKILRENRKVEEEKNYSRRYGTIGGAEQFRLNTAYGILEDAESTDAEKDAAHEIIEKAGKLRQRHTIARGNPKIEAFAAGLNKLNNAFNKFTEYDEDLLAYYSLRDKPASQTQLTEEYEERVRAEALVNLGAKSRLYENEPTDDNLRAKIAAQKATSEEAVKKTAAARLDKLKRLAPTSLEELKKSYLQALYTGLPGLVNNTFTAYSETSPFVDERIVKFKGLEGVPNKIVKLHNEINRIVTGRDILAAETYGRELASAVPTIIGGAFEQGALFDAVSKIANVNIKNIKLVGLEVAPETVLCTPEEVIERVMLSVNNNSLTSGQRTEIENRNYTADASAIVNDYAACKAVFVAGLLDEATDFEANVSAQRKNNLISEKTATKTLSDVEAFKSALKRCLLIDTEGVPLVKYERSNLSPEIEIGEIISPADLALRGESYLATELARGKASKAADFISALINDLSFEANKIANLGVFVRTCAGLEADTSGPAEDVEYRKRRSKRVRQAIEIFYGASSVEALSTLQDIDPKMRSVAADAIREIAEIDKEISDLADQAAIQLNTRSFVNPKSEEPSYVVKIDKDTGLITYGAISDRIDDLKIYRNDATAAMSGIKLENKVTDKLSDLRDLEKFKNSPDKLVDALAACMAQLNIVMSAIRFVALLQEYKSQGASTKSLQVTEMLVPMNDPRPEVEVVIKYKDKYGNDKTKTMSRDIVMVPDFSAPQVRKNALDPRSELVPAAKGVEYKYVRVETVTGPGGAKFSQLEQDLNTAISYFGEDSELKLTGEKTEAKRDILTSITAIQIYADIEARINDRSEYRKDSIRDVALISDIDEIIDLFQDFSFAMGVRVLDEQAKSGYAPNVIGRVDKLKAYIKTVEEYLSATRAAKNNPSAHFETCTVASGNNGNASFTVEEFTGPASERERAITDSIIAAELHLEDRRRELSRYERKKVRRVRGNPKVASEEEKAAFLKDMIEEAEARDLVKVLLSTVALLDYIKYLDQLAPTDPFVPFKDIQPLQEVKTEDGDKAFITFAFTSRKAGPGYTAEQIKKFTEDRVAAIAAARERALALADKVGSTAESLRAQAYKQAINDYVAYITKYDFSVRTNKPLRLITKTPSGDLAFVDVQLSGRDKYDAVEQARKTAVQMLGEIDKSKVHRGYTKEESLARSGKEAESSLEVFREILKAALGKYLNKTAEEAVYKSNLDRRDRTKQLADMRALQESGREVMGPPGFRDAIVKAINESLGYNKLKESPVVSGAADVVKKDLEKNIERSIRALVNALFKVYEELEPFYPTISNVDAAGNTDPEVEAGELAVFADVAALSDFLAGTQYAAGAAAEILAAKSKARIELATRARTIQEARDAAIKAKSAIGVKAVATGEVNEAGEPVYKTELSYPKLRIGILGDSETADRTQDIKFLQETRADLAKRANSDADIAKIDAYIERFTLDTEISGKLATKLNALLLAAQGYYDKEIVVVLSASEGFSELAAEAAMNLGIAVHLEVPYEKDDQGVTYADFWWGKKAATPTDRRDTYKRILDYAQKTGGVSVVGSKKTADTANNTAKAVVSAADVIWVYPEKPMREKGVAAGITLARTEGKVIYNFSEPVSLLATRPENEKYKDFFAELKTGGQVKEWNKYIASLAREAKNPDDVFANYMRYMANKVRALDTAERAIEVAKARIAEQQGIDPDSVTREQVEGLTGLERGGQLKVFMRQEELESEAAAFGLLEHNELLNAQAKLQDAVDRYNKESGKKISSEEAAIIISSLPAYVQEAYSDYESAKQAVIPYAEALAEGRKVTDVESISARGKLLQTGRTVRGAFAQKLAGPAREAAIGPTTYTGKVVPISAGGSLRAAGEAKVSEYASLRSTAIQLERDISETLTSLYRAATGEKPSEFLARDNDREREANLTGLMKTLFAPLRNVPALDAATLARQREAEILEALDIYGQSVGQNFKISDIPGLQHAAKLDPSMLSKEDRNSHRLINLFKAYDRKKSMLYSEQDAQLINLGKELEADLGVGTGVGFAGNFNTLTEFLRTKPTGLPIEIRSKINTFNKRLFELSEELKNVRLAIAQSGAASGESRFVPQGLIQGIDPEKLANITRLGRPMTIADIERIGINTMDEFLPAKIVSDYRRLQALKARLTSMPESSALELNRRPGDESRFSPDKEERRLIVAMEGKRSLPSGLVIDINTLIPTDRAFAAEIKELMEDLAPEAGLSVIRRRTPNPGHSRPRPSHSRPSHSRPSHSRHAGRVSNPGNPEISRKAAALRESLDRKFSSLKARTSNPAQPPEREERFTEVLDYDRTPSARVNPFSSRPVQSRGLAGSSYGKNAICVFAAELDIPCNESAYGSGEEDQKHYALCLLQLKRDIDPSADISDDLHEIASGSGNAAYYGRLAREVARLVRRASREGVNTDAMLEEVMDRCRN